MPSKLVTIDPEIMSGTPVFTGTRVPIQNLVDSLTSGETIGEFLDGFPSVSREQAIALLRVATTKLIGECTPRITPDPAQIEAPV